LLSLQLLCLTRDFGHLFFTHSQINTVKLHHAWYFINFHADRTFETGRQQYTAGWFQQNFLKPRNNPSNHLNMLAGGVSPRFRGWKTDTGNEKYSSTTWATRFKFISFDDQKWLLTRWWNKIWSSMQNKLLLYINIWA
jgi:hypothetical protein